MEVIARGPMGCDISFVIPAKNVENFIGDAIEAVRKIDGVSWELVIIDDGSTDNTRGVVEEYAHRDERITLKRNTGTGKVDALNMGFEESSGETVKCIDSDDTLSSEFYEHIGEIVANDVCCHDYYITDADLRTLAVYSMNRAFFSRTFEEVLRNLIILPRAIWSFGRGIGEKIFPIPEELPFEDIWFSLIIKRYADGIHYIPKPLYNYRQHGGQTFGGVLNYPQEKTIFRANRVLTYIKVLKNHPDFSRYAEGGLLDYQKKYYSLLAREKVTFKDIVRAGLTAKDKGKAILFRKVPFLLSVLKRVQWGLERVKRRN